MTKLKTDFYCYACKRTKPFHRFNCWLGDQFYQGWMSNICSACFNTLGDLGELKALDEVLKELDQERQAIKLTCAPGKARASELRSLSARIKSFQKMKQQILDGTAKLESEFSDCENEVSGSMDIPSGEICDDRR